jgi:acyl-CoA synthetase (NDP forming)
MSSLNTEIDFQKLFHPRNIAFIGASSVPGKWGFVIPANIIKGGFKGKFFPVNPNCSSMFGLPCYPSLSDIKEEVELAVITVPAKLASSVIDECIVKKVKSVVLITSDFSETGKEGALLEKEIAKKTKAAGVTLVGPNTMGIYNAYSKLNILMPFVEAFPGYVSIVSQSGNVGAQLMTECVKHGIGINKLISSGNEANIKCEDYISYLVTDEKTKVIALYIESLKEGQKFINICKEFKAAKPIIIYKAGKTQGGKLAAASHTGAMAGSTEIYRSVFKQCGVIEAESIEEMIDIIGGFLSYPVPKGNKVGIITIGGGWGVIAADECESHGLNLPQLSNDILTRFNSLLPKYWSRRNPVDMAAILTMDVYPKAIEIMASWKEVDSIISLGGGVPMSTFFDHGSFTERFGLKKEDVDLMLQKVSLLIKEHKESLLKLMKKYNKPIFHVESCKEENVCQTMKEYNLTLFRSPERAVKVLKKMYDYHNMYERMNK